MMNDKNYVQLPHALMKLQSINGNHKILIAIIIGYYRNDTFCFVSKKNLASIMGVCERTVYKLLGELKQNGFIESRTVTPINVGNNVTILIPTPKLIQELNMSIRIDTKIYDAKWIDYNGNVVELLDNNTNVIASTGGN